MNCTGNCDQGRNCTCDPFGDRLLFIARVMIGVSLVLLAVILLSGVARA